MDIINSVVHPSALVNPCILENQRNIDVTSFNSYPKRRLIVDTPFVNKSIISYGLIVYAKNTQRFAIIQRKHSVELLLIMRGLYRISYLPSLLNSITLDELEIIKRCLNGGPETFRSIFLDELNLEEYGLQYGLIRMAESRNIIAKLLPKLHLQNNLLTWNWPKGRLQICSERETPIDCAKREFYEEVEINLPPPIYIADSYLSENIKTVTGRHVESRYWIYIIEEEISMPPILDHPEISNRMWVTASECRSLLSDENLVTTCLNIINSIVS